jgi:hypothetical protein
MPRVAIKRVATVLVAGTVLCSAALRVFAEEYLYRYINSQGVLVIDYRVPPEVVDKGYDILNADGSIYKVVPRAPTEEEMAEQASQIYRERVAAEESERLRKWDESLLLRYSSVADIEAARERGLRDLRIRISILQSNVRSLKSQVESNQARAADIERSGGKVPEEIVSAIHDLRDEMGETERAIEEREREVEVVQQSYARDIERFSSLLDQVELRRRYSRPRD